MHHVCSCCNRHWYTCVYAVTLLPLVSVPVVHAHMWRSGSEPGAAAGVHAARGSRRRRDHGQRIAGKSMSSSDALIDKVCISSLIGEG